MNKLFKAMLISASIIAIVIGIIYGMIALVDVLGFIGIPIAIVLAFFIGLTVSVYRALNDPVFMVELEDLKQHIKEKVYDK